MIDLNNKSVLITGGTGSLGNMLTNVILSKYPKIKRLVIYSRDEQKQFLMEKEYPKNLYPQIRFFIGDVRDLQRLNRAMNKIDYVIHAAAMKHVPIAEYNPDECIKTNVIGAQNVIDACLNNSVKGVVALSTDKACAPINLYGATKLTSDKLFIAANNIKGDKKISFSVVRYGNVMGSNGSVIPFFLKERAKGKLPITNENMTRFNISLRDGVKMVLFALSNSWGGELYVPKIPSYNIIDLAKAIAPECDLDIIGIRPGEKIHEEMITPSDSYNTYDIGKYYCILPVKTEWGLSDWIKTFNALKVEEGFHYNSGNNSNFLNIEDLKKLIYENF